MDGNIQVREYLTDVFQNLCIAPNDDQLMTRLESEQSDATLLAKNPHF
jgi:hypothetical protein